MKIELVLIILVNLGEYFNFSSSVVTLSILIRLPLSKIEIDDINDFDVKLENIKEVLFKVE
jgi:hypothetical protein